MYEYCCTYVDDLLVVMKDPKSFMDKLQKPPYGYKLKGIEEPKYHLGGDFYRDEDGTLCYGAKTYITRLLKNYEQLFGELPREKVAPLPGDVHPELDMSEYCSDDDRAKYQSMIGAMQWCISLCRFDIALTVITLGHFCAAPRNGHMDFMKHICGYLRRNPSAAIRYRTEIPDHTGIAGEFKTYDWTYSVYGNAQEELPDNMPLPKGKPVRITSLEDANLYHDYITGRAVTGIIHLLNKTPIDWYSKRQGTTETATYGSEFVSGRTTVEQIIDLRYTLRMLGVPLDGPAWMFGDNESVITSSTIPHSALKKRHEALAYHKVREAVASGIIYFCKIDGKENPADLLTTFRSHTRAWPLIKPLLFWAGDTMDDKGPPQASNDKPQVGTELAKGSDKKDQSRVQVASLGTQLATDEGWTLVTRKKK